MDHRTTAELITLDGNALLAQYQVNKLKDRPVCLDVDLYKNTSQYKESALLYQLRQELRQDFSETLFTKVLLYVDFYQFFQYKDTKRNALFEDILENGFFAKWADSEEIIHYVPFEKSQSQAKNCIISFIRQDLFHAVRRRLDLDIGFQDYHCEDDPLTFPLTRSVGKLSKLYAYRGLYLTEALRLEGIEELLTEERIVVLRDEPIKLKQKKDAKAMPTYTAREVGINEKHGTVILEGQMLSQDDNTCEYQPFDGVGLISPRAAAIFNRAMTPEAFRESGIDPAHVTARALLEHKMAVSFQFRMPFCKGMLHTVDFHRFLAEECQLTGDCWVEDIFGVRRNLKNADIILNQTLFKLCGLLSKDLADPVKSARFIHHYFDRLRKYNHSIYIAKTDREQRYTGDTKLTAQIINTLPLTQEAFVRLVRRHTDRAGQYQLPAILLKKGRLPVLQEDMKEPVHKYLAAHHCLALDTHVESLINSCRMQALHDLYLGKLNVEGDTRFLSRDLIYYLYRIAKRCKSDRTFRLIPRGEIYMPGEPDRKACSLFRSPHLCPNENVYAQTCEETRLHKQYLGHLQRVVFVGSHSQMPDALGGADFDGDMVVIAFQTEVVEACGKNCYREDGSGLPLIRIPALHTSSTDSCAGKYVNVQVIQNTFNSQIGQISNATMKICAAEAIVGAALPFPSSFCAILNGVEIDAAKTGVRPDLEPVLAFTGNPNLEDDEPIQTKEPLPDEAIQAMNLVRTYLKVRNELKGYDLAGISVTKKDGKYTVKCNQQELIHFSEKDENAPYVYQLLLHWADAIISASVDNDDLKPQAVAALYEMLPNKAPDKHGKYPRKDILEKVVFHCPKKLPEKQSSAIATVFEAYTAVKQDVDLVQTHNDPEQRRIMQRNLIYLLRYKYDDVDATVDNALTLRQVGNALGLQLAQKLDTSQKLSDTLKTSFYEHGTTSGSWLFCSEQDRRDRLNQLLDPQSALIATDFSFHGYNLMYFALREQHARAVAGELRQVLRGHTGDSFLDRLYNIAADAMDRGYSASHIRNHLLPRLCREKLEELVGETDPNALIPLVYKKANALKNLPLFWKLFSWQEIETYLKGVHKNAQ